MATNPNSTSKPIASSSAAANKDHLDADSAARSAVTATARQLFLIGPVCLIGLISVCLVLASTPHLHLGGAFYAIIVGVNMALLALSSWSGILGAAVALWERRVGRLPAPEPATPSGTARTAILMPVYEEDPVRVFAAATVMANALLHETVGTIDLFVLSDTQSAAGIAHEEEVAAGFLSSRAKQSGPATHYRRRTENIGRKAGNIADFCARWGGDYDFMIVLDADSLMTGGAIARLVGAMEANPRAGLIQTMCYPIGRTSLFARIQQFSARLHGPLLAKGVAFWQGPHGSYWGHNAILRLAAFTAHCGLPNLPGRAPLGGEILCHDTVEAALMLRGGWDVWMIPDGLDGRHGGSWEETPTNLLDHLDRDRRWCQGNLQHGTLLAVAGLRTASLVHLGQGILHYLSAPLFLVLMALSTVAGAGGSPLADRVLLGLAIGLMFAPRLLSVATTLADAETSRTFGGRAALIASACLDQLFGFLIGPVTLTFYTAFVAATLAGRIVRWDRQPRDDRGLGWREAWKRLALPVAIAGTALAFAALAMPLAIVPLAPGLLLAIPVAVWSSRAGLGNLARRARLFVIPEETDPPAPVQQLPLAARGIAEGRRAACASLPPAPPGLGRPVVTQALHARSLRQRRSACS